MSRTGTSLNSNTVSPRRWTGVVNLHDRIVSNRIPKDQLVPVAAAGGLLRRSQRNASRRRHVGGPYSTAKCQHLVSKTVGVVMTDTVVFQRLRCVSRPSIV